MSRKYEFITMNEIACTWRRLALSKKEMRREIMVAPRVL